MSSIYVRGGVAELLDLATSGKVYPLHTIISYGGYLFEGRLPSRLIANHFKLGNNLSWIKLSAVAMTELESVYQKVIGLSHFSPLYAVGDFPLIFYSATS